MLERLVGRRGVGGESVSVAVVLEVSAGSAEECVDRNKKTHNRNIFLVTSLQEGAVCRGLVDLRSEILVDLRSEFFVAHVHAVIEVRQWQWLEMDVEKIGPCPCP